MHFFSHTHIGKRSTNQDCITFGTTKNQTSANIFIVCDGVGGTNNGALAAKVIAENTVEALQNYETISSEIILNCINKANSILQQTLAQQHTKGATTLCLAIFYNNAVFIAHCGDSKFLQIRDSNIIYQTKDHSLVQILLETGAITEIEAKNHAKKNVILRSINGDENLEIEVNVIHNFSNNDLFLIASDGVFESIDKSDFIETNIEILHQKIASLCAQNSNDNNSYFLILA